MRSIDAGPSVSVAWGAVAPLDLRFAPLIARLETLAVERPRSHAARVLAAGLLGYMVLAAMLLAALAMVGGIVAVLFVFPAAIGGAIKLLIPIGGIALTLLLALRVRWPAPDGVAVSAGESPELHHTVDRLRAATRGPRIHEIRITGAMNAAITQVPRAFPLPARNLLFLGLPLMQALTLREVEAVIAHEIGHFTGRHGRTASFVYHIRTRWAQLSERLPEGIAAGLLRRFFGWYGPWFAAYSFVLARQQEYEADARAAAIVGADAMAQALIRTECAAARWQAGWTAIWSQATERTDPPRSPLRTLAAAIAEMPDDDGTALADALAIAPALGDTHPSLAQRLAALGTAAAPPPPLIAPAAETLLGTALPRLIDRLDADWHAGADEDWAATHAGHAALLAEREGLDRAAASGSLDEDGLFRHAQLIEAIDGPAAGAAAFAALVDRFPDAPRFRFRHGDALLDMGDEAGVAELLAAAEAMPALQLAALERIVAFGDQQDRTDLFEAFQPRYLDAVEAWETATRESERIDESVVLRPLDPDQQADLAARAATVEGVRWLYAGVRDLTGGPQLVLVFAPARQFTGTEVLDALIEALIPAGDLYGLEHHLRRRWLTTRLKRLPNSRLAPQP